MPPASRGTARVNWTRRAPRWDVDRAGTGSTIPPRSPTSHTRACDGTIGRSPPTDPFPEVVCAPGSRPSRPRTSGSRPGQDRRARRLPRNERSSVKGHAFPCSRRGTRVARSPAGEANGARPSDTPDPFVHSGVQGLAADARRYGSVSMPPTAMPSRKSFPVATSTLDGPFRMSPVASGLGSPSARLS